MSSTSERAKLDELRAKTDRELVALIDRQLEIAREAAEQCRTEAQTAYLEAVKLLPLLYDQAEHRRLEHGVQQIRQLLEARLWRTNGGAMRSAAAPC